MVRLRFEGKRDVVPIQGSLPGFLSVEKMPTESLRKRLHFDIPLYTITVGN
jgi:hypothetical protein